MPAPIGDEEVEEGATGRGNGNRGIFKRAIEETLAVGAARSGGDGACAASGLGLGVIVEHDS